MLLARTLTDDTIDALVCAFALTVVVLLLGAVYAAHLHPPMSLANLGARRTGLGGAWAYVAARGLRAALVAHRAV